MMGKYGEEGDKLLFKILNSGDFGANLNDEEVRLAHRICEKGLRYDLTVPFARYVVQHQNEITFPFKRYQIQPVWRADRPQKGRYREFYQCDVDIIGSRSLLNEVELISIVEKVFSKLGINVVLKLNNRKVLYGIAEVTPRVSAAHRAVPRAWYAGQVRTISCRVPLQVHGHRAKPPTPHPSVEGLLSQAPRR